VDEEKIEEKLEEITEKPSVFTVCKLRVLGQGSERHIEADCGTKEASHELAELLEREVVIRVKPGKVTEEA